MHQFESYYLRRLSCINYFCSLRYRGGLKINFEIGISILCFRRRQVSLRPWHCNVKWMKISNDVYFQSCQLMCHGLIRVVCEFTVWLLKRIRVTYVTLLNRHAFSCYQLFKVALGLILLLTSLSLAFEHCYFHSI